MRKEKKMINGVQNKKKRRLNAGKKDGRGNRRKGKKGGMKMKSDEMQEKKIKRSMTEKMKGKTEASEEKEAMT